MTYASDPECEGDLYESNVREGHGLEVYWCFPASGIRATGHWYAKVWAGNAHTGGKFADRAKAVEWARAHHALATGPDAKRWADRIRADRDAYMATPHRDRHLVPVVIMLPVLEVAS